MDPKIGWKSLILDSFNMLDINGFKAIIYYLFTILAFLIDIITVIIYSTFYE